MGIFQWPMAIFRELGTASDKIQHFNNNDK